MTAVILWIQLSEMRLENRAWVGADGLRSFDFKPQPDFSVAFDITNSGKTPALDVRMKASSRSLPKDQKFIPAYAGPQSYKSSLSVIQPQMHTVLSTLPSPVSAAQYQGVRDGAYILYAYGDITYKDVYEHSHETLFCVMYYPGLAGPSDCDAYNSAR